MSLLSGSMSYARFFVQGALPEGFREKYLEALALRAMRPLDPDEDVEERSGWCALSDPYQLELTHERVYYNNFLNLGFRSDRWAIPAPVLKTKLREAETLYLAQKGRERLAKREREELKQLVTRKLRKQFVPTVRVVDFSWSLEENLVRFYSHAARSIAAMADLFAQTFGLELTIEAPYTLAARLGLSEEQERAWQELSMTQLNAPPVDAVGDN
jgi:recombination associated protein RdgC